MVICRQFLSILVDNQIIKPIIHVNQVAEYHPDIILMDNWLPDVGGIEATQELKKHPMYKDIPVIYFSANNDIKALAETAGAESYLAKPFDIDELEEKVVELIGR